VLSPVSSSVSKWFINKRGVAIGFASMGISLGTVTLTPLAGYIVGVFSWRQGLCFRRYYIDIGVLVSQTLMRKQIRKHTASYRMEIKHIFHQSSAAQAVISFPLTILKIPFLDTGNLPGLAVMISMSVFVHQVAYATDNGIDKDGAAASLAAIKHDGFIGQSYSAG